MLNRLKQRAKHFIRFVKHNNVLLSKLFQRNDNDYDFYIYLTSNLLYWDKGRYLYSYLIPILRALSSKENPSYHFVIDLKSAYSNSGRYRNLMYRNRFMLHSQGISYKLNFGKHKKKYIFVTDNPNAIGTETNDLTVIFITYNKFEGQYENLICLPYIAHPKFYQTKFKFNSDSKRKCRIVFMGNQSEGYDNGKFTQKYAIPNRYETIRFLSKVTNIKWFKNIDDFNLINANVDDLDIRINHPTTRLSAHEYLDILKDSVFFLALPGMCFPMAHNVIEAMYSGCIPIIAYNDWFIPPLEDGKNCFVYDSNQRLKEILFHVATLSNEEIALMRKNVLEYVDQHLSLKKMDLKGQMDNNSNRVNLLIPYTYCYPEKAELI